MDLNFLTLKDLGGGAAEELFGAALRDVLRNIDDPNTAAEAKRQIAITITFRPDENRGSGEVLIDCRTKLAGVKPTAVRINMGRHQGEFRAVEMLPQERLFSEPHGRPQPVEGQAS